MCYFYLEIEGEILKVLFTAKKSFFFSFDVSLPQFVLHITKDVNLHIYVCNISMILDIKNKHGNFPLKMCAFTLFICHCIFYM